MSKIEISPLARQFAPWSFSKAGIADTCPAQFEHKYLKKTPEVTVSDNVVGTAAHTILEHRVTGTSYLDATKIALEKTPLTSTEQETLRTFEERIEAFVKRFDVFCKRNGVTEILREVEWGITDTGKKTGFFAKDVFFRGKVDLGAVTRDKDLFVVDHKSGMAKDLSKDTKKKQQLYTYGVLALANVEGLAGIRGGIHFLQGNEALGLQWIDYIDAARLRNIFLPWLFSFLNDAAENLVEPYAARPKPKWPCGWCGYRSACKPYEEMIRAAQG